MLKERWPTPRSREPCALGPRGPAWCGCLRVVFPTFSSLDLPVGGDRMRPGLGDVLQLAVCEFGIDATNGWLDGVEAGREECRAAQLRAFVREFPDIAFEGLRQGGYVDGDAATADAGRRGEPAQEVLNAVPAHPNHPIGPGHARFTRFWNVAGVPRERTARVGDAMCRGQGGARARPGLERLFGWFKRRMGERPVPVRGPPCGLASSGVGPIGCFGEVSGPRRLLGLSSRLPVSPGVGVAACSTPRMVSSRFRVILNGIISWIRVETA